MVVVYCVISFILGWRLSSWAKSEPFAKARVAHQDYPLAQPAQSLDVQDEIATLGEQLNGEAQDQELAQADESGAWFFDGTYLDEENEPSNGDSIAQAERYFIDNFNDDGQMLPQRITALKAALSMNDKLFEGALVEQVYQLLLKVDESEHPDDVCYMLSLMDGKVGSEKLPGLAVYLKSASAAVREDALKAIVPIDSQGLYRKHVEHILNNDPQMDLRAIAFVLLEQYYSGVTETAA